MKTITLLEFADIIGKQIQILYRPECQRPNKRFYAQFVDGEIKNEYHSPILAGDFGNGDTPNEALKEYASCISGKILVFNAFRNARREHALYHITFGIKTAPTVSALPKWS